MDPHSCVQVHINGCTITRNLKQTVRYSIGVKELANYYCSRFEWSKRTCENIEWAIFGAAYKKRIKKNFWWTHKFHLRKLPTRERMQKRGGCDDERCCSCGASLETDDHLLQCPNRPQFKRRILASIANMRTRLDLNLYFILYNGIANYINNTSSLSDSDDDSQPNLNIPHGKTAQQQKRKCYRPNTDLSSFSLLINKQHTIGWDNLLRGKISKHWRQLQR